MVGSRAATAAAGLAASLLVSVVAWVQFDTLLLFLLVPFVPLLFRRRLGGGDGERPAPKRCPVCGFETAAPDHTHCPRDGTPLE